ncbi:metal ABC transporter substrate-binding protein [Methylobrevis albus]|uniref:Metal ABC transporter substrate-binding protein n=1 Tax=Methylobrevis albus TaxID=2793297 RepID=A0A931I2V1_9HYPH|nr:metal ABC transporter substrate-binding protein [Methylobrevis albus]MBH0237868.1 metal ABC transporter substrate-binding protein [Methylobrevis albus]
MTTSRDGRAGRVVLAAATGLIALVGLAANPVRADEPKRIVTTFTILADIAQNVAGDKALVESITKPGAEIHDYEPTPLDVVRARSGDLVLWNGLGLERWFERFFAGVDVPSVVVSDGVAPIAISEGAYEGKPNPHAWMSPANAAIYVENIRKALAELDPANADAYAANAAAYLEKLAAIDAPIRDKLAGLPADQRVLVTCEGAFSYLARDYGLTESYLWAINADEQGSPQQIRRVIDTVRDASVPVVFCESTVNDRPMQQVASETGARYGGTLYVDSLTPADGPAPTYLDMMALNAETLTRGFDVVN